MKQEFFVVQLTDMPDNLQGTFCDDNMVTNDSYYSAEFGHGEELDNFLREQGATEEDNILVQVAW
jgi:hypothetical protein